MACVESHHRAMIAGLILAGGQAKRMGGADKALIHLAGKPLIAHVVERLKDQAKDGMAISANGDPARFANYGLPVLPDRVPGFPGPLAGILAGMDWAKAHCPDCRWLLSAPCDAPFIPRDLAQRLLSALQSEGAELAQASSGGRDHPVIGLWPLALADDLRHALTVERLHKVGQFARRYKRALADFSMQNGQDPFMNVNTQEELMTAQAALRSTMPE
ncbi:Molybdenum cofactor guanylyltransferase [Rhodospirillaceae bacterium LM-1]|nr:Molybdenum cofactor guanylyltransferase [Rhodospirillaceae bacterium LM-1]